MESLRLKESEATGDKRVMIFSLPIGTWHWLSRQMLQFGLQLLVQKAEGQQQENVCYLPW